MKIKMNLDLKSRKNTTVHKINENYNVDDDMHVLKCINSVISTKQLQKQKKNLVARERYNRGKKDLLYTEIQTYI